ncbi:MAG: NAD(P)-dependent alcohol dehydrogenase [Myxococcota bacterium]
MSEAVLMRAAVYDRYGGPEVLKIGEVARPEPGSGEILVEVVASSINAGDHHLMRGRPLPLRLAFGIFGPRSPTFGNDVAGRVAAVGADVSEFQVGDEVYGDMSNDGFGAHAEFVTSRPDSFAHKPRSASFVEAACVPTAAMTALQGLRDHGELVSGEELLVLGASGGVGHFAVQIAKAMGARVTAATSKSDFARELGADDVLDYRTEDFSSGGRRWDVIFSAGGSRALSAYASALAPKGRFVHAGGAISQLAKVGLFGGWFAREGKQLKAFLQQPRAGDLRTLNDFMDSGRVRPFVDEVYPLQRIADALTHFESGGARGKLVVTR